MNVPDAPPPDQSPAASPVVWIALEAAAVLGVLLWLGCYALLQVSWPAAILAGVLIGAATRWFGPGHKNHAIAASVNTLIAGCVGYVLVDQMMITWVDGATGEPIQPSVIDSTRRLMRDFFSVLLIAIGAYLAYAIARRSPAR